ncbi:MAG: ATP-binding protein, partial [Leptolyngbyaceae cyanobacterium RM2_2_4]|nr:ATP-binding protein [Leptolyngbyaceae cyanobacterium RM2_2_4]
DCGDRHRLRQVMINLVSNASEAMSSGEAITCTVVLSPSHISPSHVDLQIHNPGAPIPQAEIPQLTQPFYTTKPSGTGLGLAIVQRIIDAHKGELDITSDEIAGTTVTVCLPRYSDAQQA